MSEKRLQQPGVEIDKSLWQEFRQEVQSRKNGVRGHLRTELENAIRDYLEGGNGGDVDDRLRRMENQLETLVDSVGGVSDGEQGVKTKDSDVSQTVKNRLEKIEEQIEREAAGAHQVHESVVNKAIEENAGGSRPTLDRYKEMLEQRHIAHEWPEGNSRTWWLDNEKFVKVLDANFPNKATDHREKYGQEWFESQLPDDDTPGFQ